MRASVPLLAPCVALAVVLVTGCGELISLPDECASVACGPCPSALTVKVTRAGGGPVQGVVLEGESAECHNDTHATFCSPTRSQAGAYAFTVAAPGYQPKQVSETVDEVEATGCCSCGYDAKLVELELEPE